MQLTEYELEMTTGMPNENGNHMGMEISYEIGNGKQSWW